MLLLKCCLGFWRPHRYYRPWILSLTKEMDHFKSEDIDFCFKKDDLFSSLANIVLVVTNFVISGCTLTLIIWTDFNHSIDIGLILYNN